jgi:hypothetical protein
MVEVFKTDVTGKRQALLVLDQINVLFPHYQVNFDLQDCDRILRIQSNENINGEAIIAWLKTVDVYAEVLNDVVEYFDVKELFA